MNAVRPHQAEPLPRQVLAGSFHINFRRAILVAALRSLRSDSEDPDRRPRSDATAGPQPRRQGLLVGGVGGGVFPGGGGVVDQPQRPAGAFGGAVGVGPVDGERVVPQQIPGAGEDRDLVVQVTVMG